MSSIKQLAESTSELICSGQVIRNLTDVVKELVENALGKFNYLTNYLIFYLIKYNRTKYR